MRFPAYDKRGETGIPWLGELPSHWQHVPIWLLFEIGRGRVISHEEIMDNLGEFPVFSSQTENNGCMGAIATFDFDGEFLTWTTDGANAGTVFRRSGRFNCTNVCGTLKPKVQNVVLDYAVHAVGISTGFFVRHDINPKLMNNVMAKIRIPLPPPDEQKAISSFLDVETSKIDGLVSEQRRLIELLKEKRQAVISHAATKGLNPNAPMKPSGIQWLGDVPQHWEVMSVHRLARKGHKTFTDGDWIERPYVTDSGVRLLQTGNVGIGHFKEQGFRYVSEETFDELNCTELKPRDVLVCRLDGPVGRACLTPDLGVRMITSVDNAILKVRDDICPDYVVDVFTSIQWLSWIEAICRVGGGFRLRISRTMLGHQQFPIPPYEEQVAIAEFIDREQAKTEKLAKEAERAIELLQERRTALISAAVTGKIDVRQFVPKEEAA